MVLPIGTVGVVSLLEDEADQRQMITWGVEYSAWDLFALVTCSLLHAPGIGIGGCGLGIGGCGLRWRWVWPLPFLSCLLP